MNLENFTAYRNILRARQPIWATKEVEKMYNKLNINGQRGNLATHDKPKNARLFPDSGLDDPLFADRNIRRYGTDIYFLDVIDDETQLILQVMLKQAQADFLGDHLQDIITQTLSDTITIHLNSPGGYAYCGLALYDFIKQMQVPVTCVVEGSCASAATLILLACEERHMMDNSVFLMHQCSWGAWGENRYMQDEAENSRKLMSRLRHIYMDETEIGIEYKDEKQREMFVQSILEHDRYFSKEECKQLGILKCECDGEPPLSEESIAKLNDFAQKLFEEEGICFYKPFPLRKLGIKDILVYMALSRSVTDYAMIFITGAIITAIGALTPMFNKLAYGKVLNSGQLPMLYCLMFFMISAAIGNILFSTVSNLITQAVQTVV